MHDLEYAEELEIDSPFSEVEEMEYAANLLGVTDEAELDQFLGDLFKKAASAVGTVIKSPIGQQLGGLVKGAIKQALPGIGSAVGGFIAPGAGAAIGSRLASHAGRLLGLELEGLSPEDQEFAVAKRLVRLIGSAAQKAAQAVGAPSTQAAAKQALFTAARKYAPGLLRTLSGVASTKQADFATESPFSEVEEMEYAANLLGVTDEAELDQFLGDLFKKAASAVGSVIKTPIGQQLGGLVKGAIKQALPSIGSAVGGFLVPGAGAAIGSQLASRAGQLLGLELEGLSPEDQEFEVAKRLIRLIGSAAQKAAQVVGAPSAEAAAKQALFAAARKYAPGLMRTFSGLTSARESEIDTPFSEVEEMEHAASLLEITDEAELEQFIGDLLKKATSAVGKIMKTPIGQQLGGYVKGAIKKALPGIGSAVGGFLVPGAGSAIGSQLASRAGQLLGLELEGLSPEDQEFEAAKRLVRFAGAAAQTAASMPGTAAPATVVKAAVAKAARRHAPGLLRGAAAAATDISGISTSGSQQSGRWVRRGGKILLLDI